jgi:hypothetical protein
MKRSVLLITAVIAIVTAAGLVIFGHDPIPGLASGLLALFLIYALWNPPKKHKDYSLSDQQQATSRALGGGGMTDLLELKPTEEKRPRKKG